MSRIVFVTSIWRSGSPATRLTRRMVNCVIFALLIGFTALAAEVKWPNIVILYAAEMAWKQGVDLYGASSNRLALGFEYTAKYNLGHDVRYEPYRSFEGKYFNPTISPKGRGSFAPIYERIVYHYHGRKGMEMPFSREAATKGRSGGRSGGAHVPWGALMFVDLPKFDPHQK